MSFRAGGQYMGTAHDAARLSAPPARSLTLGDGHPCHAAHCAARGELPSAGHLKEGGGQRCTTAHDAARCSSPSPSTRNAFGRGSGQVSGIVPATARQSAPLPFSRPASAAASAPPPHKTRPPSRNRRARTAQEHA